MAKHPRNGGYQVIKKWLSYREHKLLGRPLTTDEAREVMNIAIPLFTIIKILFKFIAQFEIVLFIQRG
jgi:hypothetical protein